MPDFHKTYYDTEGPFGTPMKDRQARELESLLKTLPRELPYEPQTAVIEKSPTELLTGERADVSWISEESIDRQSDVVLAAGMDDSNFKLNPLVTMQHAYWLPPVGRSLWRKRVRDGPLVGIKAKTQYPQRPGTWPPDSEWPPDTAFTLVQSGLLCGKSVGFLPLKARRPTDEEATANPAWARVNWIIEKWLLLEYACVFLMAKPKIYGSNPFPNIAQNAPVPYPTACRPRMGFPRPDAAWTDGKGSPGGRVAAEVQPPCPSVPHPCPAAAFPPPGLAVGPPCPPPRPGARRGHCLCPPASSANKKASSASTTCTVRSRSPGDGARWGGEVPLDCNHQGQVPYRQKGAKKRMRWS